MYGLTQLISELIKTEIEGGFGANLFALDLEGDMPIHLAIDFHHKSSFTAILEIILLEFGIGNQLSEEPAPF